MTHIMLTTSLVFRLFCITLENIKQRMNFFGTTVKENFKFWWHDRHEHRARNDSLPHGS